MKFLNFDSVLCLSPHPDDIEFSMGGSIIKHTNTYFTSIVFSTGSVQDKTSNEDRWKECNNYWKNYNNIDQHFLATLMKTYSEEEWINYIEAKFPLNQYRALLIPSQLDTHFEHRFVHYVAMALTRVTPITIIEYKAASALDTWLPNTFIDISKVAEKKVKLLKKFTSQSKKYFEPEYMQAFHTHLISLKKGINTVEQFKIIAAYL